MRQTLWMLLIVLISLAARSAHAGLLYSTGFESPTDGVGQLTGQDNWFGSKIPVVESSIVFGGSQAAAFDASAASVAANPSRYGPRNFDSKNTRAAGEASVAPAGSPCNDVIGAREAQLRCCSPCPR